MLGLALYATAFAVLLVVGIVLGRFHPTGWASVEADHLRVTLIAYVGLLLCHNYVRVRTWVLRRAHNYYGDMLMRVVRGAALLGVFVFVVANVYHGWSTRLFADLVPWSLPRPTMTLVEMIAWASLVMYEVVRTRRAVNLYKLGIIAIGFVPQIEIESLMSVLIGAVVANIMCAVTLSIAVYDRERSGAWFMGALSAILTIADVAPRWLALPVITGMFIGIWVTAAKVFDDREEQVRRTAAVEHVKA